MSHSNLTPRARSGSGSGSGSGPSSRAASPAPHDALGSKHSSPRTPAAPTHTQGQAESQAQAQTSTSPAGASAVSPSSVEVSKNFIPGSFVESHFDLSITPTLSSHPPPHGRISSASFTNTNINTPSRTHTPHDIRVHVHVCGNEVVKHDKPYVHYVMNVSYGALISWRICRRYRDFEKLHEKLRGEFGKDIVPSLPKKSINRTFKQSYIDEMTSALNIYMRDLLLDHQLSRSRLVCAFLVDSFDTLFASILDTHRQHTQHTHDLITTRTERDKLALELHSYQTQTKHEMDILKKHVKDMSIRYEEMNEHKMKAEETTAQQAYTIKTLQHAADTSHVFQQQVSELQSHVNQLNGQVHTLTHTLEETQQLLTKLKAEKKLLVRELKEQMKKSSLLESSLAAAELRVEEQQGISNIPTMAQQDTSSETSATTTSTIPSATSTVSVTSSSTTPTNSSLSTQIPPIVTSTSTPTSLVRTCSPSPSSVGSSTPTKPTSRVIPEGDKLSSIDKWLLAKLAGPNTEAHVQPS